MRPAIILAILGVIISLVLYSLHISYKVRSDREFFRGVHKLSARELFDTLAASWLMLGNVFLACLLFGKYYGIHNWWLVLTWLLAFLMMMRHVSAISRGLTTYDTLHTYLFAQFNSQRIRVLAALITATTGLGIIALEAIVVMSLLVPVVGSSSPWLPFVGGFAILLTLAVYSVLGGFTAVTETDTYQLYGVGIGLIALACVIGRLVVSGVAPIADVRSALGPSFSSSGTSSFWFFAGLFFLQVPLFLGDFGTWQRIKACDSTSISAQRKTFGWLGTANAVAWLLLIAAGIVLAAVPAGKLPSYPDSHLYALAGPIVDLMSACALPGQFGGEWLNILLMVAIVVGLVCAMMSTADSYLLITIQAFYDDILPRRPLSPGFTASDVKNAESLINKVQNAADPVSVMVKGKLRPEWQKAFASPALQASVVVEMLNWLVNGEHLYDATTFGTLRLGPETKRLVGLSRNADQVKQLNRLLLEDVYPDELMRMSERDATTGIKFARAFSVVAVLISFAIAVYVVMSKANFIPIVSLMFSLQAALAPLAVVALYLTEPERFRTAALRGLFVTVAACACYGFWAIFWARAGSFNQVNVTFILPVMAFVCPLLFLGLDVWRQDGLLGVKRLLHSFLGGEGRSHS